LPFFITQPVGIWQSSKLLKYFEVQSIHLLVGIGLVYAMQAMNSQAETLLKQVETCPIADYVKLSGLVWWLSPRYCRVSSIQALIGYSHRKPDGTDDFED